MRTARTLFAGAALSALLAIAAPAAHATGAVNAYDPGNQGSSHSSDRSPAGGNENGPASHDSSAPDDATAQQGGEGSWHGKEPHGGVHTGGGGMALSGGGMAAGSVLLLGGLGAGAVALRRRRTPAGGLAL
ncbi:hypothetical protein [Streptomyces sp. IBSBF 2435]|uniref:hypothetical protein n=1 Tax=Streptomyces sp. IBSBF 2435 TaxID=2903531 RepID=UPI002FDC0FE4